MVSVSSMVSAGSLVSASGMVSASSMVSARQSGVRRRQGDRCWSKDPSERILANPELSMTKQQCSMTLFDLFKFKVQSIQSAKTASSF